MHTVRLETVYGPAALAVPPNGVAHSNDLPVSLNKSAPVVQEIHEPAYLQAFVLIRWSVTNPIAAYC